MRCREGQSLWPGGLPLKEHLALQILPSMEAPGDQVFSFSRKVQTPDVYVKCHDFKMEQLLRLFVFVVVALTAWTKPNLAPGPAVRGTDEEWEGGSMGGQGSGEGQVPGPSYTQQPPCLLLLLRGGVHVVTAEPPCSVPPAPGRRLWEEPGARLCIRAQAAARLGLSREGPSFPFPKAGLKSGKLLCPTVWLWPACVQTAWPGKSAPHGTGPPRGPAPLAPSPLHAGSPNERAFTQECARPGPAPGPEPQAPTAL